MRCVSFVLLGVILAIFVDSSESADPQPKCVSLDGKIENKFVQPLRKKMVKNHLGYKTISDVTMKLFGYSIVFQGGKFGNLSTVDVKKGTSSSPASKICVAPDSTDGLLTVNLSFPPLELSYKNIALHLPLFDFGESSATMAVKGVTVEVNVALDWDAAKKTCSNVKLQNVNIGKGVKLELAFAKGFENQSFAYFFNYTYSYFTWLFKLLGIFSYTDENVYEFVGNLLNGQPSLICNLLTQ